MGAIMSENGGKLSGERDVLLQEGDWRISRKAGIVCLGCIACHTCACGGTCYKCKLKAPTKMVGMLQLIRWGREVG
jgi:hypothetical protein